MRVLSRLIASAALLLLVSCGEGGTESSGGGSTGGNTGGGSTGGGVPPQDFTAPALESLSSTEVGKVVAQAAAQAQAEGRPAVIAVSDRVGNILAVFEMTGAPQSAQIPRPASGAMLDVQGASVPAAAAAIAKALTGAYLSSGGNAFSSRTASMIVQEHFPPAPSTAGLESGPLFGVQFSQLPCSDLTTHYMAAGAGALIGPKRSPLGLAADPGGFPLYKNGVLVGAVGVLADGIYGLDKNILDVDSDVDERIALAGTIGFEAPEAIRANRIPVDGTSLRFSDAEYSELADVSGATFATIGSIGMLKPVTGYYPVATLQAGTAYGSEASGIRRATAAEFSNSEAFVLSNGAGSNRYPVRPGTDAAEVGTALTADEVRTILEQAFIVMSRARGQIRRPLDSRAQVSVSVVDTRGVVLGIVRAPDAPIFGIDVSLQKARTASFFSHPGAGDELLADPSGDVRHFVPAVRTFLNDQTALTGTFAFADRSGGNLSRPYFPDGEIGRPHGPLSRPIGDFNPFSTGLQSALVFTNLIEHLTFVTNMAATDTAHRCTKIPDVIQGQNRLHNGIQIFPGSVPVYRNGVLVGGVGVSGDGIDQDDMISFLGVHNAGQMLGTLGNAPLDIRADNIVVTLSDNKKVRLRFVNCPFAPFLDSSEQNVCEGL